MNSAILMLNHNKEKVCSDKPLAFHELIDRPFIQHIIEELSASGYNKISIVTDETDKFSMLGQEDVEVFSKEDFEKVIKNNSDNNTLLIEGYYPLLKRSTLKSFLKMSTVTKVRDAQIVFYPQDKLSIAKIDDLFIGKNSEHEVEARQILAVECVADVIKANENLSQIINNQFIQNGVTIMNGATVRIGKDVRIAEDCIIDGDCRILGDTTIGSDNKIIGLCRIENCQIDSGNFINSSQLINISIGNHNTFGPHAHLRMNAEIGDHCRIGNFVEIKNSKIGDHVNISHLSYIGDSKFGSHINIGCHVVTVNYDGVHKNQTVIRDHAFIGSGSNLIAPVVIGEKVVVAAGSTITDDVEDNAMAIARNRQENKPESGKNYLERED